jgi:ADP-ribose pyrophosphatase YjhB (NUDIX family)
VPERVCATEAGIVVPRSPSEREAGQPQSKAEETAGKEQAMTTPTVAIAGIVFDREDRVLLVQRGKPPGEGLWTVPGGSLEPGETLAQGVAREVREETGLVVEVGTLACVVEAISEEFHYVIHDYFARPIGGKLAAGSDAKAVRWATPADLDSLPLTDGLVLALSRAKQKRPRGW